MTDTPRSCSLAATAAVLAILLASLVAPTSFSAASPPDGARADHSPIAIEGDAALAAMAAEEGWQGEGTADLPYLIQGYLVDARGGTGIGITGTSVHVTISGCEVYNATAPEGCGILLAAASNVVVEHTVVRGSAGDGLRLTGCADVAVRDCRVLGSGGDGVRLSSLCERVTVTATLIEDSVGYGLRSTGSGSCLYSENTFLRNHGAGTARSDAHVQAYDDGFDNAWYRNERGNHWSDWTGPDDDGDGIVDVLYGLDGIMMQDHYPLVERDRGLPAVTVLSPEEGDAVPGPEAEIVWQAVDPNGILSCTLTVDGNEVPVGTATSRLVQLEEGEHTLTVTATDGLLLESSATVRFLVSRELPSMPRELAGAAADGSAELSWLPPKTTGAGEFRGYRVYQDGVLINTTEQTALRVSGLTNGAEYEFNVSAVNEVGEGINATATVVPATRPGAVTGLTAGIGPSTVTLSWDAPHDGGRAISSYLVLRDGMAVGNVTGRSFNETGLTNGAAYRYEVQAWNGMGGGPLAAVDAVPLALPGAPVLTVTAGPGSVRLSFHTVPFEGMAPVERYIIYRGPSPDALTPFAETELGHYNDTAVEAGTTYYYGVSAASAVGEGAMAAVQPATLRASEDGAALLAAAAAAVGAVVLAGLLWRRRR